MTTNAKNNAFTTPQSAAAEGEVERENPTPNVDSSPQPQAELIPVAPYEGDTREAELNVSPASETEPITTQEPVMPASKRATAITDLWPNYTSIDR